MRAAVLVLLVTVSTACPTSNRGGKIGGQPSWRQGTEVKSSGGATPQRVVFSPSSPASARYGEAATPAPSSPLGDAVIAAVATAARAANIPAPVADGRLFTAAEELARVVPDEGVIAYSLVEFALQRQGIVEPSPHLLVIWGHLDAPQAIVDQLAPRVAELLAAGATARLGVGAARRNANGEGVVVFALQGSSVAIDPLPRALPRGGSVKLTGKVLGAYRDPEVFVTRDDGAVVKLPSAGKRPGEFAATIDCTGRSGKQQVEVTAVDASGSTVLANFPLWCFEDAPSSITVDMSIDDRPVVDAAEAEQRMLALVNRDRTAAGLAPLVWDDRVAEVSRAHSREMQQTGIVAHVSPTTGTAADRVKLANIKTPAVLENVARAYGVGEAHAGLMNSPGHRANVLSGVATHIGIGVVLGEEVAGRRELFVTQVFTRVPPRVDPAAAVALVRAKIEAVDEIDGDPQLEQTAQRAAERLARGDAREATWNEAKRSLEPLAKRYKRIGSVLTAVADLDALTGDALIQGYMPDNVGIGIAQGTHPEIGEGAIWVVLLLGEHR
jgi:uncharacterized protein YkwD